MKKALEKPKGKPKRINYPLKVSSLAKMWHHFIWMNGRFVLPASFSLTNKRFSLTVNGKQGAGVCLVASLVPQIIKMEFWDTGILNQILIVGDSLYSNSLLKLRDKSAKIRVDQIQSQFYFFNYFITFEILNRREPFTCTIIIDKNAFDMVKHLTELFEKYQSFVMEVNDRFLTLWKYGKFIFLFDPSDHQLNGEKWLGMSGTGHAICVKFHRFKKLSEFIIRDNLKSKLNVCLWPVKMQMSKFMHLIAPENLEEVEIINEKVERKKEAPKVMLEETPRRHKRLRPKNLLKNIDEAEKDGDKVEKRSEQRSETPKEIKKISHFTIIDDRNMGIIRGTTHQRDAKFSRFRDGEQSLSQAVAPLVMRLSIPAREWMTNDVNEILKLGETIHHKSLKNVGEDETFTLATIEKTKIVHNKKAYSVISDQFVLIGQLETVREDVVDLLPGLVTVLSNSDHCIVIGPIIVTVWSEDRRYFMYDPNQRGPYGTEDLGSGVACVTWFLALEDLVDLYKRNVPKELRREEFQLSKVAIEDYVDIVADWFNFKGITRNKWILRGTMSQNDKEFPDESRNTQCTANAAMSIVFCHIRNMDKWSKHTVNQALLSGDEYYRDTVKTLKRKNKFVSKLLMLDELKRNFSFSQREVTLEIRDCQVNGMVNVADDSNIPNIKMGLKKFFESFDYGVLTCRGISVGVWQRDGIYYYFDSHSRDDKGLPTGYGAACVIRVLSIDELSKSIEDNLPPSANNMFNIGAVFISIFPADEGIVRLPLNNYTLIEGDPDVGIINATINCKDKKYITNAGKQRVPMCLVGLGMNRLKPSDTWDQETLRNVLDIGDSHFEDCMTACMENKMPFELETGITSENVLREFKIGLNDLKMEFEVIAEGNVENDFVNAMSRYLDSLTDKDELEILLETDHSNFTVAIWKIDNRFFLFDPSPRDQNGQTIGKENWTIIEEEEMGEETEDETEAEEGPGGTFDRFKPAGAGGIKIAEGTKPDTRGLGFDEGEEEQEGEGLELVEEEEEKEERPRSRGEGVFQEDEEDIEDPDAHGKSCILFFYKKEHLINHIFDNIRPSIRSEVPFKITKVKITNVPLVDEDRLQDPNAGNWFEFVKIDEGRWILMGEIDLTHETFQKKNRGRQKYACILAALAFAKLFNISNMKPIHIAAILGYGDRLFTHAKRIRKNQLAMNEMLLDDEIEEIIHAENLDFEDYPQTFVMGNFKLNLTVEKNYLIGDAVAKSIEGVLDLGTALDQLFQQTHYGIIECKGYAVGVWYNEMASYMFDPNNIGVDGVKSSVGYPAITRFSNTELLGDLFVQNVPKGGQKIFVVHKVIIRKEKYVRPKEIVQKIVEQVQQMSGFTKVAPGKWILRGGTSQIDEKWGKARNGLSAAAAMVALAMTCIHKPQTWSTPILDEILQISADIFRKEISNFSPWGQIMTPETFPKDFCVGAMEVNVQILNTGLTGVLIPTTFYTLSLRQGLEKFFVENSHGILYSRNNLCYAIWRVVNDGFLSLYLYDPNRMGANGMPAEFGSACVLVFDSEKLAAQHIINLLGKNRTHIQYSLIPIEIVVKQQKITEKTQKRKAVETCPKVMVEEIKDDYWKGRTGYIRTTSKQWILRGTRCLTSHCYDEKARGNQDIAANIAAFVASYIKPLDSWTWKEIDTILNTGTKLYIDSYVAYNPIDKKLGLENIIRHIIIMNCEGRVRIYKPLYLREFNPVQLTSLMEKWFLNQNYCLFYFTDQWISIFYQNAKYYIFDPYCRDRSGGRAEKGGVACVSRFESLNDLVFKMIQILLMPDEIGEPEDYYHLTLVRLEGGIQ